MCGRIAETRNKKGLLKSQQKKQISTYMEGQYENVSW